MTEAARLLRYARKRAGLTQRALAAKAGVPQPYIARIESSAADPTVTSLSRLLRACDTTLEAMPGVPAPAAGAPGRIGEDAYAALTALSGLRFVVVGRAAAAAYGLPVDPGQPEVCPHPDDPVTGIRTVAAPPGTAGYADLARSAEVRDLGALLAPVAALTDLIRIARACGDPLLPALLARRDEVAA